MRIIFGVTGGIAAYKAVSVVRTLVEAGHSVQVIPTESALRFVGRPTWEAISRNPVHTDLFTGVDEVRHVSLGQGADVLAVAPATANTIARLSAGLADDLLLSTILASTAPLVLAPAMHTEMWSHAATVANIATLTARGAVLVGPASGRLTGSDTGVGRLAEPSEIVAAIESAAINSTSRPLAPPAAVIPSQHAAASTTADLAGQRIVISAGGTREAIDPVRFIGNRSSGKQGVALATAARDRGADVVLVAAHLDVDPPANVRVVNVTSTSDLHERMLAEQSTADIVIMAAAVADFRAAAPSDLKISKQDSGESVTIDLVQNPDILKDLADRSTDPQRVVGFAAETVTSEAELIARGRAKRIRKGCDFLVLNNVSDTLGFGADVNSVVILDRHGDVVARTENDKLSVAHVILDAVTADTPSTTNAPRPTETLKH